MRLLAAALVLAVPAAALGGLVGLASVRPDDTTAACATWAREYREARNDLSDALRLWREEPAPGARRPPEPDDVRARVGELADARPARCAVDSPPRR